MTAALKDELCGVRTAHHSVRVAEVSTLLRFAGELRLDAGTVVIEAEVDRGTVADRLRNEISELFGSHGQVRAMRHATETTPGRYVVRFAHHGARLARQCGLVDHGGRPTRGLPARIVGGTTTDSEAIVRGAFLAAGDLFAPRRSTAAIICPSFESSLAVAGAARRLDVATKTPTQDADSSRHQVLVRDPAAISTLLTRIGAPETVAVWNRRRAEGERHRLLAPLTNFDNANQRRAHQSALVTAARVRRAFEILGEDIPDHLAAIGRLRIDRPGATIDELGRSSDPPISKDTASGRLRRLLATADTHALATGVADTASAVTPEVVARLSDTP
ncbi:DNA-binding protein WhiA [Williamsia sp.]|uniref:DNA-binding protein WhiA n=1 Tax=Williamsia sp. TaxID=1872085 RepID=UPI001A2B2A68|nr:DNA-binding protein WhiA [Williamsia sp.]MBJ7291437.1 DNA-binding protein WhiA [Williamsia sp.]